MKKIVILGSTGSIGTSTLDVIQRFPDHFQVVGLAARSNVDVLEAQVKKFRPAIVCLDMEAAAKDLAKRVKSQKVEVCWGVEGLIRVATHAEADMVVSAIVGAVGLIPTISALESGKDVALANKETLVMAGELVIRKAREKKVNLLPVDSEHSAVFQCLQSGRKEEVKKIILTASGGPFRNHTRDKLHLVTPEEALNHPRWEMGKKISVDSATLMNKGLEVLEAHWLFDVPIKQVEVLIHPQSIVHSMVEYQDGSIIAQLGITDMRIPILYALSYPRRLAHDLPSLDLAQISSLTFERPDLDKFPCLGYALAAGRAGGTAAAVLNAANEVAVRLFLGKKIKFTDIPRLIRGTLDQHQPKKIEQVEEVLEADRWARQKAQSLAWQ
jgi:1-deoxy-D-xylulose-5-phosphate reductoisomerase